LRRFLVLAVLLSACAHAAPIDDPKDDAPLHARVALRCPALSKDPSPGAAEGHRVKGTAAIPLSQPTLERLMHKGYNRVTVVVHACVDPTGTVSCIDFGGDTRPREIAQTIVDSMQEWKYEPYRVNGEPVPVCQTVIFNYKIQ